VVKMQGLLFLLMTLIVNPATADESGSGFGLSAGLGIPFLTQGGVHYRPSNSLGLYLGFNQLKLSAGEADLNLTMPEFHVTYHPMAGAFFVGLGLGQEKLEATATETNGTDEAKIEVTALTTIAKLGWMWGVANGGFWFGLDFAYIIPSGAKTTITAPGVSTTDQAYIDAVDAAEKFGETAYLNFTFARFGWIF
jgi:hypothetical protein